MNANKYIEKVIFIYIMCITYAHINYFDFYSIFNLCISGILIIYMSY